MQAADRPSGETVIGSDIHISGAHTGIMKLRLTLRSDARFQIYPNFDPDENGQPRSWDYAEYDGLCRKVEDLAP